MIGLDSPIFRIAAATGEEPNMVLVAFADLSAKGYTTDDIWTLARGALDDQMTMTALAHRLGPKA